MACYSKDTLSLRQNALRVLVNIFQQYLKIYPVIQVEFSSIDPSLYSPIEINFLVELNLIIYNNMTDINEMEIYLSNITSATIENWTSLSTYFSPVQSFISNISSLTVVDSNNTKKISYNEVMINIAVIISRIILILKYHKINSDNTTNLDIFIIKLLPKLFELIKTIHMLFSEEEKHLQSNPIIHKLTYYSKREILVYLNQDGLFPVEKDEEDVLVAFITKLRENCYIILGNVIKINANLFFSIDGVGNLMQVKRVSFLEHYF